MKLTSLIHYTHIEQRSHTYSYRAEAAERLLSLSKNPYFTIQIGLGQRQKQEWGRISSTKGSCKRKVN